MDYKWNLFCEIISKQEIAPRQFELLLMNDRLAAEAQCGQFIHIAIENGKNILRRPISICDAYDNITRIIFEVKGEGTQWLSERSVGDRLSVLGPLGTGFTVEPDKKAYVIGGGIGVFPLFKLVKELKNPEIFLGFRSRAQVVMEEEFAQHGTVHVATDDASYGYGGYAIDQMKAEMKDAGVIYACGPTPLLRAVKVLAAERGIPAQISMEQRMGCGIGACLVCVCKTKSGYDKVCQKGPVFDAAEVEFE